MALLLARRVPGRGLLSESLYLVGMSGNGQESQPHGSFGFVENSILDTIIPSSRAVNIEEALPASFERLEEGTAFPLSLSQRRILFFGKPFCHTLQFYVLLIHRS